MWLARESKRTKLRRKGFHKMSEGKKKIKSVVNTLPYIKDKGCLDHFHNLKNPGLTKRGGESTEGQSLKTGGRGRDVLLVI